MLALVTMNIGRYDYFQKYQNASCLPCIIVQYYILFSIVHKMTKIRDLLTLEYR